MSSLLVSGKIAMVTGGGSGIGRATCRVLEREGAKVIVADINFAAAQETVNLMKEPNDHLAIKMDVRERDSIEASISASLEKYKAPPTLIANSAGLFRSGDILSVDTNIFADVMNTNVKGTFLVNQVAANAMIDHGSANGCIVNISSIVNKTGGYDGPLYSGSMGAIFSLTKSIAKSLIGKGIRVNCVSPGIIDTKMSEQMNPKIMDRGVKHLTPLGRKGKPKEVAEVITFLLSERSSFMVGACVEITGGLFM